jgi:uncharacterized membrane protein YjgN (DUF898 family)
MNESGQLVSPEPLLAASSEPAPRVKYRFEFRGDGAEYFRIWIVNLLLTIVTLGIFSAWAKVRRLRYFYGNAVLDGHTFEYHASPVAILKGRLIVFGLYVLFLVGLQLYQPILFVIVPLAVIGIPWVLLRARRFQLRMTSWRNVHFGFGGRYGSALVAYTGWHFILLATIAAVWWIEPHPIVNAVALIVVALLYPLWVHKRVEYSMTHARYGCESFEFFANTGRYYSFCLATAVMSVVAYFLFFYLFFTHSDLRDAIRPGEQLGGLDLVIRSGPLGWALLLLAGITAFAIAAYYKARLLNASFGATHIGLNYLREELKVPPLAWIYVTNLLGILFTLGAYYPWAKIRLVRYQLECMYVDSDGRFAEFLAGTRAAPGALGEEAGDFFDVDLGI